MDNELISKLEKAAFWLETFGHLQSSREAVIHSETVHETIKRMKDG